MARLKAVDPATATGETKELLDGIEKKLGKVPNIMRTLANSPAALRSYLGQSTAVAAGVIPPAIREQIAVAVGEQNGCEYCVAAHAGLGKRAGLSEEEVQAARRGTSSDPKAAAVLSFTRAIVDKRGFVSDADLAGVREGGFDDGAIAEIVAIVAVNIFTNYFNHVADTEIDFPKQPPLAEAYTTGARDG